MVINTSPILLASISTYKCFSEKNLKKFIWKYSCT